MEIIRAFNRSDKRILYLYGKPGCGKTFSSAYYLYRMWKKAWKENKKWNFFFVKESELFGVSKLSQVQREVAVSLALNSLFVVVDDVGQVTEERELAAIRQFYEMLFESRRKMKIIDGTVPKLILTSNLPFDEIPFSDRAKSRFSGVGIVEEIADVDFRKFGLPDFVPSPVSTYNFYG
jgi:DNA replication protein DnaC